MARLGPRIRGTGSKGKLAALLAASHIGRGGGGSRVKWMLRISEVVPDADFQGWIFGGPRGKAAEGEGDGEEDEYGIIKAASIEGTECHAAVLDDLPSFVKVAGLGPAASYLSSLIPSSVPLPAALKALKDRPKEVRRMSGAAS
jgi:hypothetical protein